MNNESLAKTSKDLMLLEPFYGLFLMSLHRMWSNQVPTAGVALKDINYKLYVNPEFWDKLSSDHRMGLLKHELLHIAFFHLTDYEDLRDKRIANIAMDLEINQYIDMKWLPEGGVTMDLFPELNLDAKAGTRYYYDKLTEAANKNTSPALSQMLEGIDAGEIVVEINGDNINLPDHSSWGDTEGMDEATKKLIHDQTKHILNEIANSMKGRGTIPGEIEGILDKINQTEPPKFNWRAYLRRFAGGSQKTYTKKTRRKFNKRYEENPGLKIKVKKHILVGIDTSGSVSEEELKEFMHEIYHMYKTGAEVTVAHADTAIQKIHPFSPKEDYKIYGRGGTDFQPVIDYYNENHRKYACLIYVTDGEAPAPETNNKGKILWVLSSKSAETDHLPGKTIKLN